MCRCGYSGYAWATDRKGPPARLLDRSFIPLVELGKLAREVFFPFDVHAVLVRPAALRSAFAIAAVQLACDVHSFHDLTERREPHPIEPAVVGVVNEDL